MAKVLTILFLILGVFSIRIETALPQEVPRVTKEHLRSIMDNPDVVIIDVRVNSEWTSSSQKIKGAIREEPGSVDSWMDNYPKEKTLVFYCS